MAKQEYTGSPLSGKIENDVYIREWTDFSGQETITFKHPEPTTYVKYAYDWYMTVALEKSDKVQEDRDKITASLLMNYRWAIREGYQHSLDSDLKNKYDQPRNRNTVVGIILYTKQIVKLATHTH